MALAYANRWVLKKFLKHLFFSNTHTQWQCMAGFEPGILYSGDGRDDHYATPPWHFAFQKLNSFVFYWLIKEIVPIGTCCFVCLCTYLPKW
jgi:hypothetical protein